jgi:hypothetical protein
MRSNRKGEIARGLGHAQRGERSTLTPQIDRASPRGSSCNVGKTKGPGGDASGSKRPRILLNREHDSQDSHGQRQSTNKRRKERAYSAREAQNGENGRLRDGLSAEGAVLTGKSGRATERTLAGSSAARVVRRPRQMNITMCTAKA